MSKVKFVENLLFTLISNLTFKIIMPIATEISVGHPSHISVTSYGHPKQNSVTIGMRILLKLKMREKMKFFTIFTMLIVILRSFYIIYAEISCHLIVPLTSNSYIPPHLKPQTLLFLWRERDQNKSQKSFQAEHLDLIWEQSEKFWIWEPFLEKCKHKTLKIASKLI